MSTAGSQAVRSVGEALRTLSPSRTFGTVAEIARVLRTNAELIAEMTRRELGAGHAGHSLGPAWVFLHPLIIVGVYLLIFGFVIGVRIAPTDTFPGDFPSYVMIGLVPWLAMQAALVKSPSALVSNASLVKQVVFPIEVLPVAAVTSSMLAYGPALCLALIYKLIAGGGMASTILLLPILLALHAMLSLGLAFALSALTAFLRDVREFVNVFCVVAMYFTPAVYLPEWVPAPFRPLLYANPFSYLVWAYQDALFYGSIKHPVAWIVLLVLAVIALCGGYRLFKRLGPYYGNVL